MGVEKLISALHGFVPIWKPSTVNIERNPCGNPTPLLHPHHCTAKNLRAFLNDYLDTGSRAAGAARANVRVDKDEGWKNDFPCRKENRGSEAGGNKTG